MFYLEPVLDSGKMILQTRSFFNYKSVKELRKTLGLKVQDDLMIQNSFTQSETDANTGTIRVLVSSGTGIIRKYFSIESFL
jgi:hypothetical protein